MLSEFGKQIKHRLVDMDLPQSWLIEKVKEDTGLYFDSPYLARIINGRSRTPKIMASIRKILDIKE